MPGPEKALALDLHRQFERAREHPGEITRTRFDQLFQDRLHGRILPSVHSLFSMVVQQLHGIPEWAAPAGARPGRGSWPPPRANFQTSGYSTLGWAAAATAIGTAYIRELGRAITGEADFRGPMAKPQRMAVVTGAASLAGLVYPFAGFWVSDLILVASLWVVVLG
ncbi:MAG: hypothetical protein U5K36_12805 [Roseovarius sp.]|nr:hypothetical protein [Roseovarius sp.]